MNALNDISDYVASAENNNTFHKVITDVPGIVTYYTDGFENVTVDNFTAAMFDESNYSKNDLKTNPAIQAGSPEYKLIDSEYWNIIVPVPDATAESLKDDDTIKIRFLKDAKEAYATYSIVERDGQQYLILSLKSAMVRYASERYVEIELLLSEETGLKIPNSAITGKEFYTVPIDFFLKGGDSSDEGILVERTDKDGKSTTEFVTPTIYYETDDTYYIDSEYVSSGDILQKPEGFLLVDSGGHYYEGTTDITRTFVLGPISDEMKQHFTAVCRSNMKLANAKFLYGACGLNLDILARGPLWDMGIDYKCGTGHGVGYILNVHEGPNGFRWKIVPERHDSGVLEEGMITTDEPGVYLEGKYGIRTENELVCHKAEKNEYGQFMEFENITYAPIDLDGIDPEQMSPREKRMLNDYHKKVYEVLSPYMTEEENKWLKKYTRAI